MGIAIRVILVVVLVGLVLYFVLPRPLFVIEIQNRTVRVTRGKLPGAFIRGCEQMMTSLEIPDCTIRGFRSTEGVTLKFSRELPSRYHQNFRNLWHLHT